MSTVPHGERLSTFLNGGKKTNAHLIELVQDRDGKVIFRADKRDRRGCNGGFSGGFAPEALDAGKQLIDPITAYHIESMLQGVVQRGMVVVASSLGRPLGGKTGTTNEYRSAWFVGFSPQIVVATYIGFDDTRSLGHGETGLQAALPIFIEFMQEAIKGTPRWISRPPPNASSRR